ncbi:hypothetical protein [Lentilactobacillus senioris]|uniref:hypothetical protein n=1 Tax=Lentilactobacillus senioris TaxID=931534 RepID=UPI003D2C6273
MLAILWVMLEKTMWFIFNLVFYGVIAYVLRGVITKTDEWLELGGSDEKSAKK